MQTATYSCRAARFSPKVPSKSTISNVLCCLSDWTREFDLGNSVDVIYLDFSRAFDRVPKRHLLLKLQHMGIRRILQWMDGFLSKRKFKVLSEVPQGSVLGPVLFIVYTADLKKIIKSPFAMYANGIKLYVS